MTSAAAEMQSAMYEVVPVSRPAWIMQPTLPYLVRRLLCGIQHHVRECRSLILHHILHQPASGRQHRMHSRLVHSLQPRQQHQQPSRRPARHRGGSGGRCHSSRHSSHPSSSRQLSNCLQNPSSSSSSSRTGSSARLSCRQASGGLRHPSSRHSGPVRPEIAC